MVKNIKKKIKKELKKDKLLRLEIVISSIVLILVIGLSIFSIIDNKHTVTFNSNGGTVVTSKKVNHKEKIKQPEEPIKEGYKFVGWYYNDELYSFDKEVTEDMELLAKWEEVIYSEIELIELNFSDFVMKPSSSVKLKATVTPNVSEKIYWDSSDSSIVEVDSNGVITAKKEGIVTIKASTINGLYDELKVEVDKDAVSLKSITFIENEITISKGSIKSLEINYEPLEASNKNVIWTSDNSDIVSVDSAGVITAKKEGTAIIVVTSLDDDKIQKCKVNVISN